MSFASKVLYTGDGSTTNYNVPMPYISVSHIDIYVDEILQLDPMNYSWSGASTIIFRYAPGDNSAIDIRRNSSPTATLVDFINGSVLNESDLDTAYLHNYYLTQEYADSFNEVINNALVAVATGAGIIVTETDEVIAALVNEMLDTAAAAELQARITDIDANAEAIITMGEGLQVQITTLAAGVAAAVYVQAAEPVPGVGGIPDPIPDGARWYDSDDDNMSYIYISSAWVNIHDPRVGVMETDLGLLNVEVDDNYGLFLTEQTTRANADSAMASDLALIGAANGGDTAFVLDLNTVFVGAAESLATRFSTITSDWGAGDTAVSGLVTTEASARSTADGVISTTMSLIGAENGAKTAFILDENTVKIASDGGDTFAQRMTALSIADSDNAASITTIQTVTIPGVASDLSDFETDVQAEYGVDLTVNGYISGYRLINGGTPGASLFVILADKFAIVDPSGDPGETEYVPFEITGGKINITGDVTIDGDLMVSGTINGSALINGTIGSTQIGANAITTTQLNANAVTAAKITANTITGTQITGTTLSGIFADLGSITAGDITIDSSGFIKGGQTAYDTGSGFWLGYSSGYKFSIGDGSANSMTWDGTTLTVKGDLFVGDYVPSDNVLASGDTEQETSYYGTGWERLKRFTTDRAGSMRIKFQYRHKDIGAAHYTEPGWRIYKNDVFITGATYEYANNEQKTYGPEEWDVEGLAVDDTIEIYARGGAGPWGEEINSYVKEADFCADVTIGGDPEVTIN